MNSPSKVALSAEPHRPYIGGQAVLEGVMMRSPKSFAVVVRRRNGSLHVREKAMADGRTGAAKLPLWRGVMAIVESVKLGSEALRFSAEQMERDLDALDKEDHATKKTVPRSGGGVGASVVGLLKAASYTLFLLLSTGDDNAANANDANGAARAPNDAELEKSECTPETTAGAGADGANKAKGNGSMVVMLLLMIGFLIALPQAAAAATAKLLGLNIGVQSAGFQAMTGAFKLVIVVGYLALIRRALPDIRRVFQYHGAEHKTISTYEANEALTVENARTKSTLHPRCGTTFLVMVALVSILVFTAIGSFLPKIETGKAVLNNVLFFLEKLPFLPVIAAITFEIQRFFARHCTQGPLRALLWPGFLCQKITTIEPTDDQLEVALAALQVTLFRENDIEQRATRATSTMPTWVTPPSQQDSLALADVNYQSFDALMSAPHLRNIGL
ncbi:MAG: DUF1385 domain-containing protein [Polyangiaceae bacterium]|nr:DUF1385 domain-containing protein [Polyangiaceae bacterium]